MEINYPNLEIKKELDNFFIDDLNELILDYLECIESVKFDNIYQKVSWGSNWLNLSKFDSGKYHMNTHWKGFDDRYNLEDHKIRLIWFQISKSYVKLRFQIIGAEKLKIYLN